MKNNNIQASDSIDKKMRIGNLFEFYCELLTKKQFEILELYIKEDLSLGEIAESFGISRQAVYDTIKRTGATLEGYEEKLALYSKFQMEGEKVKSAVVKLDKLLSNIEGVSGTIKLELQDIKKILATVNFDDGS